MYSRRSVAAQANAPDVTLARVKRWQALNPDKVKAMAAAWRQRCAESLRQYRYNNKARIVERNRRRKLSTKQATPAWADLDKMRAVYAYADAMRSMGNDVHVDHIVPINGKNVCGLHTHDNLQILPALDNIRKSNK